MERVSFIGYLRKLIQVDSGESSKSFALVAVSTVSVLLLLIIGFVLVWEVVRNGTIKTDLMGLAALVGSITTLIASVVFGKAWGDRKR